MNGAIIGRKSSELFRLIDWMMVLPDQLEQDFRVEYKRFQEENQVPYITSIERLAKAEGREEGLEEGIEQGIEQGIERGSVQTAQENIITVLETRFGEVPEIFRERINQIEDLATLRQLLIRGITIASFEDFEQEISSN